MLGTFNYYAQLLDKLTNSTKDIRLISVYLKSEASLEEERATPYERVLTKRHKKHLLKVVLRDNAYYREATLKLKRNGETFKYTKQF